MKLNYIDIGILIDALNDCIERYKKDVADVCDENGAVRADVPTEYVVNISRKKYMLEAVIKQIKRGTIKF